MKQDRNGPGGMSQAIPAPGRNWLGAFKDFVRTRLIADTPVLSHAESARSALGALVGLGLAGALLHLNADDAFWLIAPIGGSAIILFTLSHSPLAQPWSVFGSYLMALCAAYLSVLLIPNPLLAAAAAVAGNIWLMARFNCMHPPGGALALLIALEGAPALDGAADEIVLVLENVVAILAAALVVNNLIPGRRYPYCRTRPKENVHRTGDVSQIERVSLTHADLDAAIQSMDTFVDIQEGELVKLYNLAVDHAFDRQVALSCGDIMSRSVVTVRFATELEEAWNLFRAHKIRAMPVVDNFGRPIGIVTVADFLRQLDDTTAAGLAVRLQGLLRRTPGATSEKAEVVGQIMTAKIYTARMDTPVSDLVHQLSENNLHHIPVLDDTGKVAGMVTQSDLIAALYKRIAMAVA
jgi:CBS domain-containing membrane protein